MGKCFQAVILGTLGLGIGALVYALLGWLSAFTPFFILVSTRC